VPQGQHPGDLGQQQSARQGLFALVQGLEQARLVVDQQQLAIVSVEQHGSSLG
jgi:hypothetical protein